MMKKKTRETLTVEVTNVTERMKRVGSLIGSFYTKDT